VNPDVRFEEEADAEYRAAGRWYEDHRQHLGVEFFDAVDATIDQIVMLPDGGSPVPRMPADLPVRRRHLLRLRLSHPERVSDRRPIVLALTHLKD
jgi:hypothetical protein